MFSFIKSIILGIAVVWGSQVSAAVNWVDFKTHNGVAYFLFQSPQQIARYDLVADQPLAPIALPVVANHFDVDDDGVFLVAGAEVRKYGLDGSGGAVLTTLPDDIHDVELYGSHVYVLSEGGFGDYMVSLSKVTGVQAESLNIHSGARGLAISSSLSTAYIRHRGTSPDDIERISLKLDGSFGGRDDSPYHGAFPSALQNHTLNSGQRVASSNGIVYDGSDLSYLGSLAGPFTGLVDLGLFTLVLRDGKVHVLNAFYQEFRLWEPTVALVSLASQGDTAFGFYPNESGNPGVETIVFDDMSERQANQLIDPNGLEYEPSIIRFNGQSRFYLLSPMHENVFVWELNVGNYLPSIRLTGAPLYMDYRASDDHLVLAYPDQRITQIPALGQLLESAPTNESVLTNSPQVACGLTQALQFLFICDPSGAWRGFFTYDSTGALVDWKEWRNFSAEYVWNAATRRIFHLRDGSSPNDIHYTTINPDGTIGDTVDSLEHTSLGKAHPIRVREDGQLLVMGTGRIYGASSLQHIDDLGEGVNDLHDAAWLSDRLGTLRVGQKGARFEYWTTSYSSEFLMDMEGEPLALFARGSDFVAIVLRDNKPHFERLMLVDSDGDKHIDQGDAFPNDPTEWFDSDGDGVGDNTDAFPSDPTESVDSDSDGVGDNGDAFPNDPAESADSDSDGVGDNADVFPNDASETVDSDNDGVGDNGDAFPNDPAEWADSDADGVGDNADAFPNDAGETVDSDNDGVGDNGDAFPNDASESADSDSDGVGDNADDLPNDPNETSDLDQDGVGDNADTDDDNDGQTDVSENNGPNSGDANKDNVPDSQQSHVASLKDSEDQYLTLDAGPGNTLSNVRILASPQPGKEPTGIAFPNGFIGFDISLPPGGSVSLEILTDDADDYSSYYKYGRLPGSAAGSEGYYEFMYDGVTGAEIKSDRIVLHLMDGARGDNDLIANGVIVDPGAPAMKQANSSTGSSGGGGCALGAAGGRPDPLLPALTILALFYLMARRRQAIV